jgi:ABC-type polysaccharide/polyol phosphate export permease
MESSPDVPPIHRSSQDRVSPSAPAFHVYHVPRRFGLLAIMAFLTAFSLLFAGLRVLEAPPVVYLGLGTFGIIISGLQMRFGTVPREASFAAGACLLPLMVIGSAVVHGGFRFILGSVIALPALLAAGGVLGYLVGTLVAGVFLMLDYWGRWLIPGDDDGPAE